MGSSSFGGIRGGATVSRFGAAAAGKVTTAAGGPIGGIQTEAGSPYSAAAPLRMGAPATHHALLALVALEALLLIALRGGFRHHHGG